MPDLLRLINDDDSTSCDLFNHMNRHISPAGHFLLRLPSEFQVPLPKAGYAINAGLVTPLADLIVDFIAHVVSGIIDAGSEADAVNESEALHSAIEAELRSWTNDPTTPDHKDSTP